MHNSRLFCIIAKGKLMVLQLGVILEIEKKEKNIIFASKYL